MGKKWVRKMQPKTHSNKCPTDCQGENADVPSNIWWREGWPPGPEALETPGGQFTLPCQYKGASHMVQPVRRSRERGENQLGREGREKMGGDGVTNLRPVAGASLTLNMPYVWLSEKKNSSAPFMNSRSQYTPPS